MFIYQQRKSTVRLLTILLLLTLLILSPVIVLANTVDFSWVRVVGGNGNDGIFDLELDNAGNIYIRGSFEGTVDFDPGPGVTELTSITGRDFFISKFTSNGEFLWVKSIDAGGFIELDESGDIYVFGPFEGTVDFDPGPGVTELTSKGDRDAYISKLTSNGDFLWAKQLWSETRDDADYSEMAIDNAGNIVITGRLVGTVDFDPGPDSTELTSNGNKDILIIKLSSDGDFLWAHNIGGSDSDIGISTDVDSSGNVYISGLFEETVDFNPGPEVVNLEASNGRSDAFILKLDSTGNFLWVKQIGGSGSDYANHINLDATGNIYINGEFQGTIDFDPGPGVTTLTSKGDTNMFVSKLDSDGNFFWAKSIGNESARPSVQSFTVDKNGRAYMGGSFFGTIDFDPGPDTANITSNIADNYVVVLDSNGEYLWAVSIDTNTTVEGRGDSLWNIAVSNENIYLASRFTMPADFNPGPDTAEFTPSGESDGYLLKLSSEILAGSNLYIPLVTR